jgi:hypothetical protein
MAFFKKEENPPRNLAQVMNYIKKLEKNISDLSIDFLKEKEKNRLCVKKIEIKRYNPFSDVGGDQSFSIVLLNDCNDGIIITSLFGSDGNRVYAKPIKKGKSGYELSFEEKEILKKATDRQ